MRLSPILQAAACAAVLASAPAASATTRIWPGAAPCNTTVMACIAASGDGDEVVLRSNDEIDETLFTDFAVGLTAAPGYRPRLAAGRIISINVHAAPGWSLRIAGITLADGKVEVAGYSAGSIRIEQVDVQRVGARTGIDLYGASFDAPFNLAAIVQQCRIGVDGSGGVGIAVNAGSGVTIDTAVSDNLIAAVGATTTAGSGIRTGIYAGASGGTGLRADLLRNRLLGDPASTDPLARLSVGIRIVGGATAAAAAVRVADNVIVLRDDGALSAAGVRGTFVAAQNAVRIVNNTLVGGDYGIALDSITGTEPMDGVIANNLIGWHSGGGLRAGVFATPVSNANNAFFANPVDLDNPGPGTLFVDPRVPTPGRPRLAGDSPLIDSADPAFRLGSFAGLPALPDLDADGLRRRKGSGLDIGAWEYGDETLVHNVAGFAPTTTVDDPRSNGQSGLLLQLTRSGGAQPADTTPNPRPMSERYDSVGQRWQLLADDGFNLNIGAGFQLFAPMNGTTVIQHTANAGNTSGAASLLPAAIATLPSDTIVLVSPTRGPAGTGVADPHPVASRWAAGAWSVVNLDGAAMPAGASFTVYAQAPSRNAYVHTISAGSSSVLDHPELDGNPCAAPQVANSASGAANPHPLGVHYDPDIGRWRVRNEDGAAFADLARVLVLFEPKRSETLCNDAMFGDGFEQAN